jgi:serine protease Do
MRAKMLDGFTRTGARRTDVVRAIDRVKNAVVNIHSERTVSNPAAELYALTPSPNRVNGMGTGIVIDPRGYIVTNFHVVEDVSVLRIRTADGASYNAAIIARNPDLDLALIKIDAPQPLQTMPLGTAQDLMIGETVIAIGNAFGYEHTASLGIVSAIKRDVTLNKDMSYKALIQTDASINPGNSGGPLINIHGDLVGVNVAIRAGAQGIGFAIPADHMVKAVSDMLRTRRRSAAYDGLVIGDRVDCTGDTPCRTVLLERTETNSPAAKAGLRAGDVLVQIGDVKITCSYDVERALLDRKSGDSLPVVYRRDQQERRADLILAGGERPIRMVSTGSSVDVVWQRLGVQLAPVSEEAASRVHKGLKGGLEITDLSTDGAAARAGLRKGDILVGLHTWEMLTAENVQFVLNHPDLATFSPLSFYILRGGQVRRGTIALP